jgi:Na+-transporting NADH:ubiquinone oxidoreductase subunit A
MLVKQGAEVKAGEPLFYNKNIEEMLFVSPVSGELIEIERGDRRRILTLKILADKTQEAMVSKTIDVEGATKEEVKSALLKGGCWPFVKQRPYDVVANPDTTPKSIFISGYSSGPLQADLDYVLNGKED